MYTHTSTQSYTRTDVHTYTHYTHIHIDTYIHQLHIRLHIFQSFWSCVDPLVSDEIKMQLLALRNSESDVKKCRVCD